MLTVILSCLLGGLDFSIFMCLFKVNFDSFIYLQLPSWVGRQSGRGQTNIQMNIFQGGSSLSDCIGGYKRRVPATKPQGHTGPTMLVDSQCPSQTLDPRDSTELLGRGREVAAKCSLKS